MKATPSQKIKTCEKRKLGEKEWKEEDNLLLPKDKNGSRNYKK